MFLPSATQIHHLKCAEESLENFIESCYSGLYGAAVVRLVTLQQKGARFKSHMDHISNLEKGCKNEC